MAPWTRQRTDRHRSAQERKNQKYMPSLGATKIAEWTYIVGIPFRVAPLNNPRHALGGCLRPASIPSPCAIKTGGQSILKSEKGHRERRHSITSIRHCPSGNSPFARAPLRAIRAAMTPFIKASHAFAAGMVFNGKRQRSLGQALKAAPVAPISRPAGRARHQGRGENQSWSAHC